MLVVLLETLSVTLSETLCGMVISTGFSEFGFVVSSEALLPSVIPIITGLSGTGESCETLAVDELVL